MHPILQRNAFFIKEHAGVFKAANNYDVLDPETQEIILECREGTLGLLTKLFRFTDYKRMTPFDIQLRTPEGQQVVRVSRGISIFLSSVDVFDEQEQRIGGFKQKFFSIGGAFSVLGKNDEPVADLKGKWSSWEFKFLAPDKRELAVVSKKFAGFAKELFTSADNYLLTIDPSVPKNDPVRPLILGAVMCIDMVLKE